MSFSNHLRIKILILTLLVLLTACARTPYVYTPPSGAAAADLFAATGNKAMIPLTLVSSAGQGDYDAVKSIFNKYPELKNKNVVNTQVRLITNTLNIACGAEFINMELIQYLIRNGADINGDYMRVGKNLVTQTPIMALVSNINAKSNLQLQKTMAKINAQMKGLSINKKHTPPSSMEERFVLLDYLIKSGANVNLRTQLGIPLTFASNNDRAITMLIKAGADTTDTEKMFRDWIKKNNQKIVLLKKYL